MPVRVGPVVSDGVVEVAPLPIVVGGYKPRGLTSPDTNLYQRVL